MGTSVGTVLIVLTDVERPSLLWVWVVDCIREKRRGQAVGCAH